MTESTTVIAGRLATMRSGAGGRRRVGAALATVLVKPFSPRELVARLEAVLEVRAHEAADLAIPAGQAINVELTSEESVDRDLVIADAAAHGTAADDGHGDHETDGHAAGGDDPHVAHADPDQTVIAALTIDGPGDYELCCSVPGHRSAGMTAELTVVDNSE